MAEVVSLSPRALRAIYRSSLISVSEIFLEDELNGTVKSVDPGGRRTVVTGRDSGTEVVLRTHDQPLFMAAKGDAAKGSIVTKERHP